MLEADGRLRTWELDDVPTRATHAVSIADHRLSYLDYEGPIADDRGAVRRWDQGSYEIIRETPVELVLRCDGPQLQGRLVLKRELIESATWCVAFDPT
jgi:hypothetical protein